MLKDLNRFISYQGKTKLFSCSTSFSSLFDVFGECEMTQKGEAGDFLPGGCVGFCNKALQNQAV